MTTTEIATMMPTTPFAVVCLNECGAVVPSGTTIATDELGPFVNCPKCGSSFDFDAPEMREFAA